MLSQIKTLEYDERDSAAAPDLRVLAWVSHF